MTVWVLSCHVLDRSDVNSWCITGKYLLRVGRLIILLGAPFAVQKLGALVWPQELVSHFFLFPEETCL